MTSVDATGPVGELLSRARDWAEADDRVAALIVHGSVAQGTADDWSDLDLVVVAREGARDNLWAEHAQTADRILGTAALWSQYPTWQRPYRYQAWRSDLVELDLTLDEGDAEPWDSLARGFAAPLDRTGVADRLRDALRDRPVPEHDAVALDGGTWVWLNWLAGRLRHGRHWFVRNGIADTLNTRVLPMLGTDPYHLESTLDDADRRRVRAAYPHSTEPDELARALRATADLYDHALTRWSTRTGHPRPANPLAPLIRNRLAGFHPTPTDDPARP